MVKNSTLSIITAALLVLNFIDTYLTTKYINFGPLTEANPFMDFLMECHIGIFIFFKICIVSLFISFLWVNRSYKIARFALSVCSCFYAGLIIWWMLVILKI